MKTLNQIRENYGLGFISQREFVVKVVDMIVVTGLVLNESFMNRLDQIERAEKHVRKAYEGTLEGDELESVLGAMYGPLVPELYELIDRLN